MPMSPPHDIHTGAIVVSAVLAAVNVILLSILLRIYLKSYKKIKSKFTTGLLVFVGLFIVQNLMVLGFTFLNAGFHRPGMGTPLILLNLVECIAFAVLLKITWE